MQGPANLQVIGLALFLWFAPLTPAGNLILVRHPAADSTWQLEDAEKITVNGKPKIRLGSSGQTEIAGDEYKRLQTEVIGATPMRVHRSGYMVYRSGSGWAPVAPDGESVKGSAKFASMWSTARLQVQKEKGSKGSDVNAMDVFAILPGSEPYDAAVDFLLDASNFSGVGEADAAAAFEERMSFLVAVAAKAPEAPANKLKSLLLAAMENDIRQANSGIFKYTDLEHGLRFAAVSEKAFPSDPQQKAARDQLRDRKAWLEQRVAILKALSAGEQWDAFIDKYGDFERFDNSFEEVRKLREKSFHESVTQHLTEGKRLYREKRYVPALHEVKLALIRNPGDKDTTELSEAIRIEEAHEHASLIKKKPVDPTSAQRVTAKLRTADNNMADGNLAEAESEIVGAEALEKDSPRILLAHAKLLAKRKQLLKALDVLNEYARLVIDPAEVDAGESLRTSIQYELKKTKQDLAAKIAKAEAEGDYVEAAKSARLGLQFDPDEPEFLYHGGFNAAILRSETEAQELLQHYLRASQSLQADSQRRAEVFGTLPMLAVAKKESRGTPHWFSGLNLPPDSFYCPVSLVPNAHPVEIKASRKQTATFQWKNGSLAAVETVNSSPGESNVTVYFDYFPGVKAVRRVSMEPLVRDKEEPPPPRLTPDGTIGTGPGTYFALLNHPVLNPYMVERLTGKRVATIVSGNPYFHPFVWTGIHTFLAEYDSSGRIRSASEIHVKNGTPHTFDFEWQGNNLMTIVERGPKPGTAGEYRREMHYAGNRITGETVRFQGKTSKIDYKYNGDTLLEANCDADASLDGRSRRVTFRE